MTRTLCIFKPDIAKNSSRVAQAIIRLAAIELVPVRSDKIVMTTAQAMRLYAAHEGQPYYRGNIEFMTSGPCFVMILEGDHAVERLREIIGATDPKKAAPGTLRGMFGSGLPRNAFHGSASEQEAEDEIRIFFEDTREEYRRLFENEEK